MKITTLLLLASVPVVSQSTLATWTLVEIAGVTHQSQPVCFPYSGGVLRYETNRVLGPAGTQVMWQQLRDGSVCVVGGLAAGDTGDDYTLQSGAPTVATITNPTVLIKSANTIEIQNGIAGARIATTAAQVAASPAYSLAPVQQILIDGAWVGNNPQIYRSQSLNEDGGSVPLNSKIDFCSAMSQTVKESGPIQVTVSYELTCTRPAYDAGGGVLRAGGTGAFQAEITVYAQSRSVLFSYYSDLNVYWDLDISAAYSTLPNILAMRGHGPAPSLTCGYYLPDGVTPTIAPGYENALRDITYAEDLNPLPYGGCVSRMPNLAVNYAPNSTGDGWNVWAINDGEGGDYPVVGLFSGAGSKNRHKTPSVGFGKSTTPAIRIHHANLLRGGDGSFAPYIGMETGYYWGPQSTFPLKTEHSVIPPIQLENNALTGPMRLTKLYRNMIGFSDPAGGWKWPYLPEDTMTDYIGRINTDSDYYNALSASNVGTEGLRFIQWARFQDSMRRAALLDGGSNIKTAIETWVNGNGLFDHSNHYYQGIYPFVRNIDNFFAVLKDPDTSAGQKEEAKGWLGLGAALANDADYFNYEEAPSGLGNENQAYQFVVFRNLLALSVSSHPSITTSVLARAVSDIASLATNAWNSDGAGKASTHYQSNYAEPGVGILNAGIKAGHTTNVGYRNLLASINWDLSILTPPEPRFNNKRKGYSVGNGNTEAAARLGLLGTVFNSTSPTLSQKALWGWRSQDTSSRFTHSSFYFPTVAMIDDQITQTDPDIGSLYMSGYHAALRTGWETVNETVAWFVHGGWYSDHKDLDNGQVSIYAHTAPLSIDWSANLYSPPTPGGYLHSRAVRESELSIAWDGTMTDYLTVPTEWGAAASTEFGKFQYGSFSKSTFGTTWTRDVRLLSHSASYPIIFIRDGFSGADASVSKIVSSMHMATGAVTVNGGSVTPTIRDYDDAAKFPSCSAGAALSIGLNRLQFTGQTWTQHATSGIDWDAYVNVSSAADYCLGNWSHVEHSSREKSEYATANGGSFRERQHILRVKTSDAALETVLLPWRKGESTTFTVTNQACGTQVVRGTHTTCSSADKVQWTDGTDVSLMATGIASVSYSNLTLSGGPAEVRSSGSGYVAVVDGLSAQNRTVTLPAGSWYPNGAAVTVAGNQFRLFHDGTTGQPRSVTFSGSASGGSISLGFSPPAGGTSVRVYIDGVAVAQEACASTCSFELQLPSGTFNLKHAWVDVDGSVFLTSTENSITI